MNRFIISVLFLLLPFLSVANDLGITTIKAVFKDNYSLQEKEEAIGVIKKRFNSYSKNEVNISFNNDSIFIKVLVDIDSVTCINLLNSKGQLLITETYSPQSIYSYLKKIDSELAGKDNRQLVENVELLNDDENNDIQISIAVADYVSDSYQKHPLFDLLNIPANNSPSYYGTAVGRVNKRDTSNINRILNDIAYRKYLPADVSFLWQSVPDTYLALYAIKNPSDKSHYISGSMIESSGASQSYYGSCEVNVKLKDEYHEVWEKLTADNIGKALAIVIDNKVYMAPIVNSEITGGRFTVSGNLRIDEAKALSAILADSLGDINIDVVEVKQEYPPMHYLLKFFGK